MANQKSGRNRVFISYSHEDSDWLKRLRIHLKPLERDFSIDIWDDTKISPGSKWKKSIEEAIESAKVAVLLISADFLASDFIITDELPPLLNAAAKNGAIVLPLILSPSRFLRTEGLSQFQSVNPPSSPLISMTRGEQEAVFVKLTEIIEVLFNPMQSPKQIQVTPDEQKLLEKTEEIEQSDSSFEFVIITKGKLALRRGIKTYSLGMNADEFEREFGKPEKVGVDTSKTGYLAGTTTLGYSDAGVKVTFNQQRIIQGFIIYIIPQYEAQAASATTDTGIKVGASIDDIIKLHGEPYKLNEFKLGKFDTVDLYYKYDSYVLNFRFDHGVFASIGFFANYLSYLQK